MESELYIALSLKLHRISQHRQPMFCARRRRRAHSALFAFREAVVPGTRRRRPGARQVEAGSRASFRRPGMGGANGSR